MDYGLQYLLSVGGPVVIGVVGVTWTLSKYVITPVMQNGAERKAKDDVTVALLKEISESQRTTCAFQHSVQETQMEMVTLLRRMNGGGG